MGFHKQKKATKNRQFCGRRLFDLFKNLRITVIDQNRLFDVSITTFLYHKQLFVCENPAY